MKKAIFIGIYILYPSVSIILLVLLLLLIHHIVPFSFLFYPGWGEFVVPLVFIFAFPIFGFYYFIKKRPFNQWLLFIGFVPVPFWIYYFERGGSYLWATLWSTVFYAIPLIIISLIISTVLTIKDKRKPNKINFSFWE